MNKSKQPDSLYPVPEDTGFIDGLKYMEYDRPEKEASSVKKGMTWSKRFGEPGEIFYYLSDENDKILETVSYKSEDGLYRCRFGDYMTSDGAMDAVNEAYAYCGKE